MVSGMKIVVLGLLSGCSGAAAGSEEKVCVWGPWSMLLLRASTHTGQEEKGGAWDSQNLSGPTGSEC